MLITEVIKLLQDIYEKYGDLQVFRVGSTYIHSERTSVDSVTVYRENNENNVEID